MQGNSLRSTTKSVMKNNTKQENVPQGWLSTKVGNLGFTYSGLRSKSKSDFGQGSPYITYMNVFLNSKIDKNRFDLVNIEDGENQSKVQYGDVFFTVSSETPEEVGMSSVLLDKIDNYYLNSFCFGFRLKDFDDLLPQYARYLFRGQDFRLKIIKMAQGSTRFNLSKERVLSLDISLPSLKEQEKIADILDVVDQDIARTQEVIETTEKLKRGLMQQLFTRRIRGIVSEIVPLGKVAKVQGGYSFKSSDFSDSGVPVIRISNIKDGYIKLDDIKYYPKEVTKRLKSFSLKRDDVVIAMSGATTGKIGIVKETDLPLLLNQRVGRFISSGGIDGKYLYNIVISEFYQKRIWDFAIGGAQPNVSGPQLESIEIPLPNISDQKEIADILSSVDEKMLVNKKLKAKLNLLKMGLMQDLLSGKVRTNI